MAQNQGCFNNFMAQNQGCFGKSGKWKSGKAEWKGARPECSKNALGWWKKGK